MRLDSNAKVQEGDSPDEQPTALLDEARRVLAEMKRLTMQINFTNLQTRLPGDESVNLMEAIAERDRLAQERKLLEQLGSAARVELTRGYALTRNEIKWWPTA